MRPLFNVYNQCLFLRLGTKLLNTSYEDKSMKQSILHEKQESNYKETYNSQMFSMSVGCLCAKIDIDQLHVLLLLYHKSYTTNFSCTVWTHRHPRSQFNFWP